MNKNSIEKNLNSQNNIHSICVRNQIINLFEVNNNRNRNTAKIKNPESEISVIYRRNVEGEINRKIKNFNYTKENIKLKSRIGSQYKNSINLRKNDIFNNIFDYSICICWRKKFYYLNKLQGVIRKDLSIENIILLINSYEIIKKVLIEKNIVEIDTIGNIFKKINKIYLKDGMNLL